MVIAPRFVWSLFRLPKLVSGTVKGNRDRKHQNIMTGPRFIDHQKLWFVWRVDA